MSKAIDLGSARVSRAGDGVSPSRTSLTYSGNRKDCFGETPKPTRETRALPRTGIHALTTAIILLFAAQSLLAQTPTPLPSSSPTDPASEPVVLAVAKVMPAVVNINAERVVRRPNRDCPWQFGRLRQFNQSRRAQWIETGYHDR